MKLVRAAVLVAVVGAAAGCGKTDAGPVDLTAEQLKEMERRQQEVAAEEKQREKEQPRGRSRDRATEEEMRRR